MTRRIAISFGAVQGTAAGLGRTGPFSVIADRPQGIAGGAGLGFNGAELLAAALGGCFWNDLHHVAYAAGVPVTVDTVDAAVELAGNPPRIVRAQVTARLSGAPDNTLAEIFAAAEDASTVASSLQPAFPVHFERLD
ncbi:MAG: OsmC family protein [Rhodobacteraceae bacterium]|nr:OsmC family protein [Paracoccaceae bacterium]